MGRMLLKLTERRVLRKIMVPGERLLDYDLGQMSDGSRAFIYLTDRAVYIEGRLDGDSIKRRWRLPYVQIASITTGPDLSLTYLAGAIGDYETITVQRGGLARDVAVDFIRERLLALPSYEGADVIDGQSWRISFLPWRPGTVGSWLVHRPAEVEPGTATADQLQSWGMGDLAAIAAGGDPDPDCLLGDVPEWDSLEALIPAWAHALGGIDETDMALADSTESLKSQWSILALQQDALWVVDFDINCESHPRIQRVGLDSIAIGDSRPRPGCPITITDPQTPAKEWPSYFLADGYDAGHRWLERLEQAMARS